MSKKYNLDLFELLRNIDHKNKTYYDTLTDEQIKEFSPLVIMRWLTGTNDLRQIYFINELVNPFVFSLSKHKKLLYYMLCLSTSGNVKRYKFPKKNNKTNSFPKSVSVIKSFFNYSEKEAKDALILLTNDDIISFAEQLGKQQKEITELKKELKTRQR